MGYQKVYWYIFSIDISPNSIKIVYFIIESFIWSLAILQM